LKIDKLLAGTLALVMILSLTYSAYAIQAESVGNGEVDPSKFFAPLTANPEDIVFENGDPNPAGGGAFFDASFLTSDFELEKKVSITDAHIIVLDNGEKLDEFNESIEYFILEDANGEPTNNIIDSGIAKIVKIEQIEDSIFGTRFLVWFDFEKPIPLLANTKYWFGLHVGDFGSLQHVWEDNTDDFGELLWFCGGSVPPCELKPFTPGFGTWFQITAKSDEVVGGEFLPIDSTALVLAGLQTSAIWMLPVLAGVAGSAFGVLYIKSRRN